ncbi:glutathione peroxidase [Corynebacterium pacaense]|uniref:glutathione peroxidase n=1 Tax=Corynebacterium pacaense TaxID=1816684 RepID=UPI0009BA8557|nr:glutathione peroxidase [Corynebacterium pacaense]
MSIHEQSITLNDGTTTTMATWAGHLLLVVNVASECGLTPQYEGLQRLFDDYRERGLFIIGAPCNQFNNQEPGTDAQVCAFARERYGVDFPLLAKLDVNGEHEHPLYTELKKQPREDGHGGDIEWNFEKFLVDPEGVTIARFAPTVDPEDDAVIAAIEANLPV